MLKLLSKMQFKVCELIITAAVCFLSLSCFSQPGIQGDIYVNVDTKKFKIEAYTISKNESSLVNFTEFIKLKTQIHSEQKNLVVLHFADEQEASFANNILLVITRNKKKMMIIMTGELDPYENYVLDIRKGCYTIFTIEARREKSKIHKNRMGVDLTPLMRKHE